MKKGEKTLLFSDRELLTEALIDCWQDSMNEQGYVIDRGMAEYFWFNCISVLEAKKMLNHKKCREFIADMRGEE